MTLRYEDNRFGERKIMDSDGDRLCDVYINSFGEKGLEFSPGYIPIKLVEDCLRLAKDFNG